MRSGRFSVIIIFYSWVITRLLCFTFIHYDVSKLMHKYCFVYWHLFLPPSLFLFNYNYKPGPLAMLLRCALSPTTNDGAQYLWLYVYMFRAICQFAQFRKCTAQMRIFQFAQLFINCVKHCAICKLPTHGSSDNCVREWDKITLVICTGA